MKNFIIEQQVNPSSQWIKYKQFDNFDKAQQSFEMLKKHRFTLFKNSNYMNYRLYDIINNFYHY